ncbi:MAG: hypothetical protein COY42_32590 [Armatimonadetes bacterium CG_4_10_14_0_8_um_filter_66_14]|nr:MAG: hypothetical protein COY42_32590 [Armatimonadetes bacterium CG_4_10_14_0_8_um_filter_66_14]
MTTVVFSVYVSVFSPSFTLSVIVLASRSTAVTLPSTRPPLPPPPWAFARADRANIRTNALTVASDLLSLMTDSSMCVLNGVVPTAKFGCALSRLIDCGPGRGVQCTRRVAVGDASAGRSLRRRRERSILPAT